MSSRHATHKSSAAPHKYGGIPNGHVVTVKWRSSQPHQLPWNFARESKCDVMNTLDLPRRITLSDGCSSSTCWNWPFGTKHIAIRLIHKRTIVISLICWSCLTHFWKWEVYFNFHFGIPLIPTGAEIYITLYGEQEHQRTMINKLHSWRGYCTFFRTVTAMLANFTAIHTLTSLRQTTLLT